MRKYLLLQILDNAYQVGKKKQASVPESAGRLAGTPAKAALAHFAKRVRVMNSILLLDQIYDKHFVALSNGT